MSCVQGKYLARGDGTHDAAKQNPYLETLLIFNISHDVASLSSSFKALLAISYRQLFPVAKREKSLITKRNEVASRQNQLFSNCSHNSRLQWIVSGKHARPSTILKMQKHILHSARLFELKIQIIVTLIKTMTISNDCQQHSSKLY